MVEAEVVEDEVITYVVVGEGNAKDDAVSMLEKSATEANEVVDAEVDGYVITTDSDEELAVVALLVVVVCGRVAPSFMVVVFVVDSYENFASVAGLLAEMKAAITADTPKRSSTNTKVIKYFIRNSLQF